MNNSDHDPFDPDHSNDAGPDDSGSHSGNADDGGRDDSSGGEQEQSDDEIWQDLVSRLEQTESPADEPPAENQRPQGREETAPAPDPVLFEYPSAPSAQSSRQEREHLGGPRDYTPEEEDDTYVPEEPPASLAGTEPLVVLAWAAAIGGPAALLLSAFFWRAIPLIAVLGIVAAFLVSVVFLLMRLPSERGDDNDDGAIV